MKTLKTITAILFSAAISALAPMEPAAAGGFVVQVGGGSFGHGTYGGYSDRRPARRYYVPPKHHQHHHLYGYGRRAFNSYPVYGNFYYRPGINRYEPYPYNYGRGGFYR